MPQENYAHITDADENRRRALLFSESQIELSYLKKDTSDPDDIG
jgi:hypothetical protein